MNSNPVKILFISPTPTHPTNAGNRRVVLAHANNLRARGYDLHFLLLEYEEGDRSAMEACWQGHIEYFTRNEIYAPQGFFRRLLNKFRRMQQQYRKSLAVMTNVYSAEDARYNSDLDDHYPPGLDERLRRLQAEHQFEVVIATYVFLSRAFLAFPPSVLRILDTHDIFSNRYKQYRKEGRDPEWISLFPSEEKKGFERADIILAIQDQEIAFIKGMGVSKTVLLMGHELKYQPVATVYEQSLLFIASGNSMNVDGINDFIDTVYIRLKQQFPKLRLLIGGSICQVKELIHNKPGIEWLGLFEHIEEAYASGCIVVCPIRMGTGVKVKLLEALAFGKACVASSAAAEGLEAYAEKYFLLGFNADDMVRKIAHLFESEQAYDDLRGRLETFCRLYNDSSQLKELYARIEETKTKRG